MRTALLSLLTTLLALPAWATEPAGDDGRVQIPLDVYSRLVDASKQPSRAPAGYALGRAEIEVVVREAEGRATGEVSVALQIEVLEDDWVLVPILPAGTPVGAVSIGDEPVQLIATPDGLAWGVKRSGAYAMQVSYHVDAARSGHGFVLPLPIPEAAATRLQATLPGSGLDVAVIPAAGVTTAGTADGTRVTATLPATRGVQLSWRTPAAESYTMSRAFYSGRLVGEAIQWTGELSVELLGDETATLDLLPKDVTLNDIEIDGQKAAILVGDESFATIVRGRGAHQVRLGFQVPVQRGDGPPRALLRIPEIPVSRFELALPGRKEVSVTPASDVEHRAREKGTVARFHVPMTREVRLSWSEAIPEDLRAERRAHAGLYHAVHAEEGVLYVDATVAFEVTRGDVSQLELELPGEVQVNRIHSENGGISDWRVARGAPGTGQLVTVFLDHALSGETRFRVQYDRSLSGGGDPGEEIPIPLLRARDVHRQRGMIALLATKEVALTPVVEQNLTRVGENQLPAFFRRTIEMTVAHTFKYAEASPELVAATTAPQRALAKFDAEVNTLISLTDVTMKGSATVNVNVKSGKLNQLRLALPRDVNLLSLTAPSLRTQKGIDEEDRSVIDVEFTQDMEGQFRLEVGYERITADADADSEVSVPTLSVLGAEVEQGRIAVEALAAVEVRVAAAEQLSSLDPSELPQQLVLKTTNPILLAYKYVHVDPPYALALSVTRHREVAVQSAAIDHAGYRTLFTRDGLAVTTARFTVRNNRKQFLRVVLPAGADVWSAAVNGKPEKPAVSEQNGNGPGAHGPEILIKVINSVDGFPVELIYATPVSELGRFGRVGAQLPRPDMVVTHSRWDVFLPDRYSYGTPTTNMDLLVVGDALNQDALRRELAGVRDAGEASRAPTPTQPLPIRVPTAGIHFAFEKLYANQAEAEAAFSIPYASAFGATLGQGLALLGTALFWGGLGLAARPQRPLGRREGVGLAGVGLVVLLIPLGYLQTDPTPPLVLSLALVLGAAALYAREHGSRWLLPAPPASGE